MSLERKQCIGADRVTLEQCNLMFLWKCIPVQEKVTREQCNQCCNLRYSVFAAKYRGKRIAAATCNVQIVQGGGGTVGQDVVELICQSERKMQQNATFYL